MIFAYIMKKCYQVVTEKLPQSEATTYCSQIYPGVHLVDLESEEEEAAVNSLVEATVPFGRYLDTKKTFDLSLYCTIA